MNDLEKYIVIAEGQKNGFVIGCYFSKLIAEGMASKIFSLSKQFNTSDDDSIIHVLEERGHRAYKINGCVEYCNKCYYCESNGSFTVSIFEIKSFSDLSLDMFIKERENHSDVYDLSKLSDEDYQKWKNIIDCNTSLIAN